MPVSELPGLFCCARFSLALLIGDEGVASDARVGELHVGEHLHSQLDLGRDRVEARIECVLRDREAGELHRHHARLAPDEEDERQVGRADLDLAGAACCSIFWALSVGGYMSSSSVASAGCRPCSATAPFWSGSSSWSAACMSTVRLIVSSGGPATRRTSSLAAPLFAWVGAGAARARACASSSPG